MRLTQPTDVEYGSVRPPTHWHPSTTVTYRGRTWRLAAGAYDDVTLVIDRDDEESLYAVSQNTSLGYAGVERFDYRAEDYDPEDDASEPAASIFLQGDDVYGGGDLTGTPAYDLHPYNLIRRYDEALFY